MRDRLTINASTVFVLDGQGRILRENDPDRSAGPRLFASDCTAGNQVFVRHDVSDDVAGALTRAVEGGASSWSADKPPWLSEAVRLLERDAPVVSVETSVIYALPHGLDPPARRVVLGETDEGQALLRRLCETGMPPHLVVAGFLNVADFWDPWCAVLIEGEIASLAFAARLGEAGAEVGVYTFPAYRGQGHAAAATAAWTSLSQLEDRELFYSTLTSNRSSQRVAERLGLEQIGVGLRIT